jgi:hypothetical protein
MFPSPSALLSLCAQGFWPMYLRLAPHTILTFVFLERLLEAVEAWK